MLGTHKCVKGKALYLSFYLARLVEEKFSKYFASFVVAFSLAMF